MDIPYEMKRLRDLRNLSIKMLKNTGAEVTYWNSEWVEFIHQGRTVRYCYDSECFHGDIKKGKGLDNLINQLKLQKV